MCIRNLFRLFIWKIGKTKKWIKNERKLQKRIENTHKKKKKVKNLINKNIKQKSQKSSKTYQNRSVESSKTVILGQTTNSSANPSVSGKIGAPICRIGSNNYQSRAPAPRVHFGLVHVRAAHPCFITFFFFLFYAFYFKNCSQIWKGSKFQKSSWTWNNIRDFIKFSWISKNVHRF